MTEVRPFGSWPSVVTVERVVAGARNPGEVRVDGDDIWWSESRPDEGGRTELVRRRVGGKTEDLLGGRGADERTWNARTAILEYGGGAWCVESGVVVFAQWDDQRLYRLVADDAAVPDPLTAAPVNSRGLRYGDLVALNSEWLLAVRETHPGEDNPRLRSDVSEAEPIHEIVAVPLDGSAVTVPSRIQVLVTGPDFVASPTPGPARLAWIQWHHPQMPWDGAELCGARLALDGDGAPELRSEPVVVAGGPDESVVQPGWDRSGELWFCSDRSDWWNLYRVADPLGEGPESVPRVVAAVEAEIGGPRWVCGMRWYAPTGDGRVLAGMSSSGHRDVVIVDPAAGDDAPPASLGVELRGTRVSVVSQVVAGPGPSQAVLIAASATAEPTPLLIDLATPASSSRSSGTSRRRGAVPSPVTGVASLRPESHVMLASDEISRPEPIRFASDNGRTAHALLYRPSSATVTGPPDERPPLVVMIHGGPTSAARPMLDLTRQFWTTRGFAVVDVDHGGSTGYGRPYRRLLDGQWGVVDVEDCIAAAQHLAAEGIVDRDRMVIRGGSAGGFTTLAALCASDAFAAGTSLFGVVDLAALARDTHKFESRYCDGLVGPLPEAADVYAARSPLTHLDRLTTPLLVLQGADDQVVPPNQAEAIVEALAANGVPHAYLLFEGEGHGFRRAETIVRALEAELSFYARILGFTPADDLPPLPVS